MYVIMLKILSIILLHLPLFLYKHLYGTCSERQGFIYGSELVPKIQVPVILPRIKMLICWISSSDQCSICILHNIFKLILPCLTEWRLYHLSAYLQIRHSNQDHFLILCVCFCCNSICGQRNKETYGKDYMLYLDTVGLMLTF